MSCVSGRQVAQAVVALERCNMSVISTSLPKRTPDNLHAQMQRLLRFTRLGKLSNITLLAASKPLLSVGHDCSLSEALLA